MPIRMSGMISGLDTDAIIKELMSAQSMKKTVIEQNKEKLSWKKEKWEDLNTKLYALYTEKLSSLKLQGTYLTKKATSSNSEKAEATATNATNGSYSLTVERLASAQFVTGADISDKKLTASSKLVESGMSAGQTITIRSGENFETEKSIEVTGDMTITDFVERLKSAGVNASFDADNGRFYISAKDSGSSAGFTLESTNSSSTTGLAAIGLGDIDEELAANGQTAEDGTTMAIVGGQDAKLVLNGATITSSKNSITANGLSINLKGSTTVGETINITVSNDVDAVYDKIKEFTKSYNELMTEMYDKFNAPSAKDYAMLTDEEKEAMSDEQVELWENKIKDSLLRRDSTLNSLMSTFRNAMQKTADIDGKSYALSSFGIVTGVYTEHGLIHINGNAEDGQYADKTDDLRTALEKDPEAVGKVLSKLFDGFYSDLTEKMSASTISSALTFYNDKQIQSQMDEYESQVKTWETRLEDIEDRYYKQFSGMEKAMADLQNQQSQLSGLLGIS